MATEQTQLMKAMNAAESSRRNIEIQAFLLLNWPTNYLCVKTCNEDFIKHRKGLFMCVIIYY